MSHLAPDVIDRLKLGVPDRPAKRSVWSPPLNESGFWFGGNLLQDQAAQSLRAAVSETPGDAGREPVRENAADSLRSSAEPPRMLNSKALSSPGTISP